jgi:ethanolamine utilization protein EutP (predicted NTPase)
LEILRGIASHGVDGKGTGGIAGAVYRAVADNSKNAVSLLNAIVPREVAATITRTDVTYKTISELDQDLARAGLPSSREIFQLDFKDSSTPEDEVAEVVETVKGMSEWR